MLTAAVLWGSGGVAGVVLRESSSLSSVEVAATRLGAGGALLGAAVAVVAGVRRARASRPAGPGVSGPVARPGAAGRGRVGSGPVGRGAVLSRVAVLAVLAAGYQGSYFLAVERASVQVATLVALGAAPVMVAVGSALVRRRAPGRRVVLALVAAVVGLVMLVAPPGTWEVAQLGAAAPALVAAACFAGITVVGRRPVPALAPATLTATAFTAAGLLLALVAGVVRLVGGTSGVLEPDVGTGPDRATASPGAGHDVLVPGLPAGTLGVVLVVGFLALVPTALAYGAYISGLRTVPATTASLTALLEPLVAAVLAAVLLGERLGTAGVLGGLLLGLAVLAVRPRSQSTPHLAYHGPRSVLTARRPDAPSLTDPLPPGAGS